MTLQERYDAEKASAALLHQRYTHTRAQGQQLEQEIIRADARLALLEVLLKPEPVVDAPLSFKKPRRAKAESDVA